MPRDALPISFSRPLIPKVIDGSKTQTRRILKPGPGQAWLTARTIADVRRFEDRGEGWWSLQVGEPHRIVHCGVEMDGGHIGSVRCPYGLIGSKLWVREDHRIVARDGDRVRVRYEADGAERFAILTEHEVSLLDARRSPLSKPQPARFMFRSLSRISLEVADVRVERVTSISEEDAKSEGLSWAPDAQGGGTWGLNEVPGSWQDSAVAAFAVLWDHVNGERPGCAWSDSPWTWAITFKVAEVRR